jgi:hypothetical protein
MTCRNEDEYYPTSGNVEVFRFGRNPLTYTISPKFNGVAKILHELQIPTDPDQSYSLSYVSIRNFLKYSGRYYHKIADRYQKYTVETFGLVIKPPPDFNFDTDVPRPDASQYKCQPFYWTFCGVVLVQVWRLRVLSCPMEDLKMCPSNPFGTFPSGTVYVAERWSPQEERIRFIDWIGKASLSQKKRLTFYEDAVRIIEGTFKLGRPQGTKKYTKALFRDKLKLAYQELYDEKTNPTPKQFALALKSELSVAAFKNYMNDIGNPKPPY